MNEWVKTIVVEIAKSKLGQPGLWKDEAAKGVPKAWERLSTELADAIRVFNQWLPAGADKVDAAADAQGVWTATRNHRSLVVWADLDVPGISWQRHAATGVVGQPDSQPRHLRLSGSEVLGFAWDVPEPAELIVAQFLRDAYSADNA